jgi:hypothetical protein
VFLQRVVLADKSSPWPTKQKMREVIKNSVINDSGRGSDYVPPPTSIQVPHEAGRLGPRNLTDGVFFPLFVPVVDGVEMSWDEFFLLRSIGFVEANLVRLATNTEMIPGLFVRGTEQPIETIRPRVRP